MSAVASKVCTKCLVQKRTDEFSRDSRSKGGLCARCKECRSSAHRAWRDTPHGRDVCRTLNRAWEERHRESVRERSRQKYRKNRDAYAARAAATALTPKGRARQSVHNAVASGRMVKPSACEVCGASEPAHRIHAHHRDYSKKRDVVWMCSVCHGKAHRIAA